MRASWGRACIQGDSVNWFRFMASRLRRSQTAKAGQHARWRELRKLQEQRMKKVASEPKNR